jgi:hypothetical protein
VGGLEGIEKRVGSWENKENESNRKKEAHPAKWMSFRSKIQSLRM